jgi:hypothetical protein
MREARRALEHDDFAGATQQLGAVASDCAEGSGAGPALLLLAAAELDTGNPGGSPVAAAGLAARYLLVADATDEDRILARTLYRVATHLETLVLPGRDAGDGSPESDPISGSCAHAAPAEETMLMEALGPAAAPWLLHLESERGALHRRVEELQAEIDRIDGLLTSSVTPAVPEPIP